MRTSITGIKEATFASHIKVIRRAALKRCHVDILRVVTFEDDIYLGYSGGLCTCLIKSAC